MSSGEGLSPQAPSPKPGFARLTRTHSPIMLHPIVPRPDLPTHGYEHTPEPSIKRAWDRRWSGLRRWGGECPRRLPLLAVPQLRCQQRGPGVQGQLRS